MIKLLSLISEWTTKPSLPTGWKSLPPIEEFPADIGTSIEEYGFTMPGEDTPNIFFFILKLNEGNPNGNFQVRYHIDEYLSDYIDIDPDEIGLEHSKNFFDLRAAQVYAYDKMRKISSIIAAN